MAWTIRTHRRPDRHNEVAETEARLDRIAGEFQSVHRDIGVHSSALQQVAHKWDSLKTTIDRRADLAS
jgi:hypothetical protein